MSKHIYAAVYGVVEDGKVTGFDTDAEALVGSYDGYVWDDDTEEWSKDAPTALDGDVWKKVSAVISLLNGKPESLLTSLSDDDLEALASAANGEIHRRAERSALALLAKHRPEGVTGAAFWTTDYENGFFHTTDSGNWVTEVPGKLPTYQEFTEAEIAALEDTLDPVLATLSDGAGENSQLDLTFEVDKHADSV